MAETKRRARVGPLTSPGRVASELARLYRKARWGEIDVTEASRLANILAILKSALESTDLEKRLVELEALLAARGSTVVPFRRQG